MRLYCKLAVLVLLACAAQAVISSGYFREGFFAARCLIANVAGNPALEERLVDECAMEFARERRGEVVVAVAAYAEPMLP